jgi:hypothetical protein
MQRRDHRFHYLARPPAENKGFTATVSFFPDTDRLAEVFLNNHRNNSAADVAARDSAILLSFALQYGPPVEDIRRALTRDAAGNALGVVGVCLDLLAEEEGG